MSNLNFDIISERENERVKILNELIEIESSTQHNDEQKLKKLYLAAITLFNTHYSSIVHTEFYRNLCEVFNLPLDNSEYISKTSAEYNRLSNNIRELEVILYPNISHVADDYVNHNLEEEENNLNKKG